MLFAIKFFFLFMCRFVKIGSGIVGSIMGKLVFCVLKWRLFEFTTRDCKLLISDSIIVRLFFFFGLLI